MSAPHWSPIGTPSRMAIEAGTQAELASAS
jgi:hypothetical protein